MIIAKFARKLQNITDLNISGHAEYEEYGKDLVCAAVSSSLQMLLNGLTEVLEIECETVIEGNCVDLKIKNAISLENLNSGYMFMEAFYLHLSILAQNYEGTIRIIISEV